MSLVPFSRWTSTASLTIGALLVLHAPAPRHRTAPPIDPVLYRGLAWRNIGPFRGGRIAAVTGVIGQPGVFYIGLPAGGVWKTTSAGETWYPVFDSIKTVSSVGAIEVAPSDPNVIYVGSGEANIRGDMVVGVDEWYVPKSRVDYLLWNRLAGVDDPERLGEE